MNRKKIVTAAVLSASIGFGTNSLLAQTVPGGSAGTANPSGPTAPMPGQPSPGLPQPSPMPGQPGTIPERVQRPSDEKMAVTSDDVRKAQTALKAKGLNPGEDGRMDAKTQQALREFQKSNNLPMTGVLDDKTAEKLGVNKSSDLRSVPQYGSSSSMPDRTPSGHDSTLPKSNSNSLSK